MNRILIGIEKAKKVLADKLPTLSPEMKDKVEKNATLSMEEFVLFQQEKSLASMDGRLTLEEAQTVYGYLGSTPDSFNAQPLEIRWVLLEVFTSLMKRKLGR